MNKLYKLFMVNFGKLKKGYNYLILTAILPILWMVIRLNL